MRAVSVPFSPGRPSRLKNEPGIFPAAYMRSSTSTVSGRKSTSRSEPATAVASTIVSPWRTTTAPEACLAILPVSNEISLPAISTETRVTAASLLIFSAFLVRPSVGGSVSFILCSERTSSLADRSGILQAAEDHVRRREIGGRRGLVAPAHDPVGADDHERALGEAALVQHAEGACRPLPWARSPRAAGCSRRASRGTPSAPRCCRRRRRRSTAPSAVISPSSLSYSCSWSVHTGLNANG